MSRRLLPYSKLSNRTINRLTELFALEVPATKAALALGISRHTAARIYTEIRTRIARACEAENPLEGEVEVDESYFGGYRKGLRGRAIAGKVPVFGLLKRGGKVYTRIVSDVTRTTLQGIIRSKVDAESVIYSDSFASYDGLVAYGYRHRRINHSRIFAAKRNHINGIEGFWAFAKLRLRRYQGIPRSRFFLYLKECEFRYNHRNENQALTIKALFKNG